MKNYYTIHIYGNFIFIFCLFRIIIIKLCWPISNLPTLRQCSVEEITQRNNTVTQLVGRMRDKEKALIRIQVSVTFSSSSVAYFLLRYSGEALEGPISTGLVYFNNTDSK